MNQPLLANVDLDQRLSKGDYKKRCAANQLTLVKLMTQIIEHNIPVVVALEGWDAAGKGGAIQRLIENLDSRRYNVYSISKPTQEELDRHYLWRFWRRIPGKGRVAIFDRSWYGRVLVERMEKFATIEEWERAYREINEFEQQLTDDGYVLLKLFLHISKDEQKKRFDKREQDPLKQWKMNPEDYRNRKKWPGYRAAIDDMFQLTHTDQAPWTVIAAENKRFARIQVQDAFIEALTRRLSQAKHKPKAAKVVQSTKVAKVAKATKVANLPRVRAAKKG